MEELRFHQFGIPTSDVLADSEYNKTLKMHATGYFESPYAIEWMNFDDDNPLPDIIKTVSHVAFVVDDLHAALVGKNAVRAPSSPDEGFTVAFITVCTNLVELLNFDHPAE